MKEDVNAVKGRVAKGHNVCERSQHLNVSDDDMHTMMVMNLRRDNMQNYLAVADHFTRQTGQGRGNNAEHNEGCRCYSCQLKSGSDFATLAKAKSVDTAPKPQGGELVGWLRVQYVERLCLEYSWHSR